MRLLERLWRAADAAGATASASAEAAADAGGRLMRWLVRRLMRAADAGDWWLWRQLVQWLWRRLIRWLMRQAADAAATANVVADAGGWCVG